FEETEKLFERLNIPTKKSDIEGLEYAIPTYEIISSGEFATNMERFDGISFGHRSDNYNNVEELYKNSRTEAFGRVVQQKIMFGNFVLSEGRYENFYVQALKSRTMIKENIEKLLDEVEFLIAPVSLYYTAGLNLAGLPSISIPFGEEGLLIATKAFNDKRLLEFVNKLISEIEGDK
ncbi:MAG: amidase family protein, partial [Neofamilia sp.]